MWISAILLTEPTFDPARLRNFRLLEAVPHCNEARYNSWGFREHEPGPGRAGVRRAVVLGSDVVEGFGVREADTLSRRLEVELGEVAWEVFSCAHPAARGAAVASGLERCLRLAPDVVVLAFSPVDVDRSKRLSARATELFGELVSSRPGEAGRRRSHLSSALSAGFREARLSRTLDSWYRDLFGESNKRGWLRTKRRIREVRDLVEERGARFVLVTWPVLPKGGPFQAFDEAHRVIGEFARHRGMRHLDLRSALRELGETDRWIHPLDARPSAAVFGAAAASIAAVLEP